MKDIEIRKFKDKQGHIIFDRWLAKLKDNRAKARILLRVRRLSLGLEGDRKGLGDGVKELRINEGKGYRIYYAWDGLKLVILYMWW